MIKAFLKYLLSACILLLSGQGVLRAHASQNLIHLSLAATLKSSPAPVVTSVSSSGREKENYDLNALVLRDDNDNDDDDELISSKKYSEGGSYSTSIFYTQTSGYLLSYSKKIFPICMHLSYPLSDRYLRLQVIRI